MEISAKNREIVQLVARFKQVTSSQVRELLFSDVLSHTPADRSLRRLLEQNYLARIERRAVGGSRGGSGQYVYQLGRRGYYLYFDGRFSPWRTVNYHALAIVDCYVSLRRLERSGLLTINIVTTEPDCWVRISSDELKPDLFVELGRAGGAPLKLWLEVDMGSEGQSQLRSKLERYWRSYNNADVTAWPVFPRIVWVAIDDERAKELTWLISDGPVDAQSLFQVTTVEKLSTLFGG